jgi:hypothetical protein
MSRLSLTLGTLSLVCSAHYPVVAESPSVWYHNGSLFTLSPEGPHLVMRYSEPRQGMRAEGVTRGTVLFEVARSGNDLSGMAYVFSRRCGRIPFRVTGEILPDGHHIALNGNPPTALDTRCMPTAMRNDAAQFDLRQGTIPPAPELNVATKQPPSAVQQAGPNATPDPRRAERLKTLLDRTAEARPPDPQTSVEGDGYAHTWRPDPAVTDRLEQFERQQRQRQEQQAPTAVPAPTLAPRSIAQPGVPPSSGVSFFKTSPALFWTAISAAIAGALVLIAVAVRRLGKRN